MNHTLLSKCANTAIEQIQEFMQEEGTNNTLESIKQQMIFIRDNSQVGKNPIHELGNDREFTYGILSSREFASPKELELKELINNVSNLLYSEET